jgi:hypothetical protein
MLRFGPNGRPSRSKLTKLLHGRDVRMPNDLFGSGTEPARPKSFRTYGRRSDRVTIEPLDLYDDMRRACVDDLAWCVSVATSAGIALGASEDSPEKSPVPDLPSLPPSHEWGILANELADLPPSTFATVVADVARAVNAEIANRGHGAIVEGIRTFGVTTAGRVAQHRNAGAESAGERRRRRPRSRQTDDGAPIPVDVSDLRQVARILAGMAADVEFVNDWAGDQYRARGVAFLTVPDLRQMVEAVFGPDASIETNGLFHPAANLVEVMERFGVSELEEIATNEPLMADGQYFTALRTAIKVHPTTKLPGADALLNLGDKGQWKQWKAKIEKGFREERARADDAVVTPVLN